MASASPQAYAIHRQDIQAAIAKAEELRALHAALLQGGAAASPVGLRLSLGSAASPSVSRASHQFAAADYPVFTPVSFCLRGIDDVLMSYEEEPLHGYLLSRTGSRTLSESLSRVGLAEEEHVVKEDIFDDKREINYSPMYRGVELYSTPDCQESKPSPCVNHVVFQKISTGTETLRSIRRTGSEEFRTVATCNKCKPAIINRGTDGDSRNYKNNMAAVHETDNHPSLQLHQKNRGAVLSWLFPRFKKKPKSEMSPNTLESEDMSQLFKDWGLCSLETLKKELIVANENRDAALAEVGEMKSSLEELKQKLVHLEVYCEELKKALKQAMQGKNARFMEKHDLTKRMKFTGISKDSSMPVSHEVMVEGFLQIASESRLSVRQFCKTLLSQIDDTDGDLVEKLNVLLQPDHLTLNFRYSKGLLNHLEGLINQTLYQDFENCVFQKNGSPKVLDPQQDRLENFTAFVALRNLSWNEVLRKGTKYYSEDFSRFCDQKMSSIVSLMDWSRPWPEQLLQSFFVATKCIWLLHLLAFSFSPPLSILRVDEHRRFDPIYMEDVLTDKQRAQVPAHVKIMVMPGFYVQDKVLRCKVLCRYRSVV
ncbi:hypothetical protein Taro_031372 [Colocasia esculenta]|uniref:GIL1/IRKI C-terminal domain-containing protein n=1 Tax=Colocasia esculenta TaxID=4460 RepID=A0A843VUF7_COLES|nr:hypothetical protein [Colocasia esculenta]